MAEKLSETPLAAFHLASTTRSKIEILARFGYATKGVVYTIIGGLALTMALGTGGTAEDSRGAITIIAAQPFGRVLVGLTALGLGSYALWRVVQALFDPQHKGSDAMGSVQRLGFLISSLVYGALAFFAGRLALGTPGGGGGPTEQQWTAVLLAQPLGQWLIGGIGVIVTGIGLAHFYMAYKARFMREYRTSAMSTTELCWGRRLGRLGLTARGVTFGMIGGFLVVAAVRAEPHQVRGLDGVLVTLLHQPYGPWLLGAMACGLVAYGIFCLSQARYYTLLGR